MNSEPEKIDPEDVRPGPIRNESLPPELLEDIRAVHEVLGPYLGTTLEQFEVSFMRDMDPEDEVAIWMCITGAWIDYHNKFLPGTELPDEDEKKLIAALIAISTGIADPNHLSVPVEVGERLIACYDGLGEEG
jgi:hypothetical protein